MKIYDYYRSSSAYRLRIALNLKSLIPEREFVNLQDQIQRSEGYLSVNPQGLVPSLLDDDGQLVSQALAIIEYLDELYPEPPLLPPDAVGRARVRGLALTIACDIQPLNNLRVLKYLKSAFDISDDRISADWYCHWITLGFETLEARLSGDDATGRFCHGQAPTMADCCLIPQVFNAERFGTETSDYPAIKRIFDTCMALDAFASAHPDRQPDAK
ncbi:MAG: maleylacetoacetate isomerase [Alphaproteobacteria bacterium]|nr:maleylacetoacetate isomerase [Alphaproteobacteria bacterium]